MSAFDPLDSWFEKGFRVRKQKPASVRRDAVRTRGGQYPSGGGVKFSKHAKAKNVVAVIAKSPEVMVKITGSSSGLATVKHHLDYISRNGKLELEDESGEKIQGKEDLKGLREALKAAQFPEDSGRREFLHVLFSMPANTPKEGVKKAVSEFCREEFGNRQYVMALHDDTDHVHVHVCVGTRDIDRASEPRLSPRKNDLFRWRQGFADKLRENGIDAAASERRHRFNHKKPENPVIRQIRADNPASKVFNDTRAEKRANERAKRAVEHPESAFVGAHRAPRVPRVLQSVYARVLGGEPRPANPAEATIKATIKDTRAVWERVGENLTKEGHDGLAAGVHRLIVDADKPLQTRDQKVYDDYHGAAKGRERGESEPLQSL